MFGLYLDDWFGKPHKNMKMGVELELTLYDLQRKELVQSNSLVLEILENLPQEIFKDYYPYQLEIRSNPHTNPEDIIKEIKDFYKLARREFAKNGIAVIPATGILDGQVFCGMHVHISYDKANEEIYWRRAMGIYPFALSIADHTKNFEIDLIHTSKRLLESRHIGRPPLDFRQFVAGATKYMDIAYRHRNNGEEGRVRMKRPATIEVRLFDTPSLFSHFKFIVEAVFNVAKYIRDDNPFVAMIENNIRLANNAVDMTRLLMEHQRYGVNKILKGRLNSDVCRMIADRFGIDFPSETQFEYRERMGLNADINGFLILALKGGWD